MFSCFVIVISDGLFDHMELALDFIKLVPCWFNVSQQLLLCWEINEDLPTFF